MDMIIFLVVIGVVAIFIISSYNGIISSYNMVKRAWADVNVYEKQKVSILDGLEPLVEQYSGHESNTLKEITALRENIAGLGEGEINTETLGKVQRGTNELMKGLNVTLESYPDLKANTIYLDLMSQIKDQNENVGAAISIFNRNVARFNVKIESVPTNIINNMFAKKDRINEFSDQAAASNIGYSPNF